MLQLVGLMLLLSLFGQVHIHAVYCDVHAFIKNL